MPTSPTISTISFIGAMVMVGLAVFQLVPVKTGLLIGGGLMVIGFVTQPAVST